MDNTRAHAAADALGSTRAEGLEPGPEVVALLEAWGRGEVPDGVLAGAEDVLAARGSVGHLLPAASTV